MQVRDTVLPTRRSTILNPPFPTYFTEEEGDLDEDLYNDDLFVHTEPSVTLSWIQSQSFLNPSSVCEGFNKLLSLEMLCCFFVCRWQRYSRTTTVCLIKNIIAQPLPPETMVTVGLMTSLKDPLAKKGKGKEKKKDNGRKTWRENVQYVCRRRWREEMGKSEGHTKKGEKNWKEIQRSWWTEGVRSSWQGQRGRARDEGWQRLTFVNKKG